MTKARPPGTAPLVSDGRPDISILGPLEVSVRGESLSPGGTVDRRMLTLLAASPGVPVSAPTLADVVYGPGADVSSLKYAIYRLRKLMGRDAIVSVKGAYLLDADRCTSDAATFDTWCSNARRVLSEGDPESALEWLEPALSLWRGEPLADLAGHPAVAITVSRLTELRFAMQVELGAALAAVNRVADAISVLEAAVVDHPLREHAWVQLMAAFHLDGRPDEAWLAFDRARLALAECGLEPSVQLREATARLGGSGDADPILHARSGHDAIHGLAAAGTFAGRAAELGSLEPTVVSSIDGDGATVVVIAGEPGVGKTRLAAEVASRFAGDVPVWFELPAPYLSLPYGPFVGLVQQLIEAVDISSRSRLLGGPLARLVSDGAVAPQAADHPDVHRFQLFEAVADLIVSVAAETGGIIVLDDMHESPVGAWQMLRHLITTRPLARVSILVTLREHRMDADVTSELIHLQRQRSASLHRLSGLSADEVGVLIDDDPHSDTVRTVHELSGGNPLYALGLARIRRADGLDPHDLRAVSTLGEAVESHLGMLSERCRAILCAASVSGRSFSQRVLVGVASRSPGLDPAEVPAAVVEAIDDGIVRRDPLDSDRLSFAHDLLRDALYRDLGDARHAMHFVTGGSIERLAEVDGRAAPPGELAHHFAMAWPECSARTAASYLAAAGRAADRRFEFAAGDDHYTRALGLLAQEGNPSDDDLRAELFILAGQTRLADEDIDRARVALSSAADLGRDRDWPDVVAVAAVNYVDSFGLDATDGYGAQLLREATTGRLDTALHADVLNMLHRVDAEHAIEASWDLVRRVGDDPGGVAVMLDHLWFAEIGDSQLEVADEMIRLGHATGDDDLVSLGELRSWMTGVMLGRRRLDDKVIDRLSREVYRSTNSDLQWAAWVWMGAAALARGDVEGSRELAERARRVSIPEGHAARGMTRNASRMATTYHSMRVAISVATGDVATLLESLHALGLRGSGRTFDSRCTQARVLTRVGRMDEAYDLVDSVLREPVASDHPDPDRIAGLVMLAGAAAEVGHVEAIEASTAALLPFVGMHTIVGRNMYLGSVEHVLGLSAGAAGDLDAAIDYLTAARDAHRNVAADTWVAASCNHLAVNLWRRNEGDDRSRADDMMSEARGLAQRFGLHLPAAEPWPPTA